MNRLFGDFLLERKIITQEQFTHILVAQIASQPTMSSIVLENDLLDTQSLFTTLKYQFEHRVDFMEALKKLNFWNPKLESDINAILMKKQTPIGELLLKEGHIDFKVLTDMLDEYLSHVSTDEQNVSQEAQIASESKVSTIEAESNNVSDEEPEYQHGILMELKDAYSEKKQNAIKAALNIARENCSKDLSLCLKLTDDLYKIIDNLNEALFLFGLEKLGELLLGLKKFTNNLSKNIQNSKTQNLSQELEFLFACCEMAWDLRCSTIDNATERVFLAQGSNESIFNSSLSKLNS